MEKRRGKEQKKKKISISIDATKIFFQSIRFVFHEGKERKRREDEIDEGKSKLVVQCSGQLTSVQSCWRHCPMTSLGVYSGWYAGVAEVSQA